MQSLNCPVETELRLSNYRWATVKRPVKDVKEYRHLVKIGYKR
jgi:hypothetical protein